MKIIQQIGAILFIIALLIFTGMLGVGKQTLNSDNLGIENIYHQDAILESADELGLMNKPLSNIEFISKLKGVLNNASKKLENQFNSDGLPENTSEWDFKLGNWKIEEYSNTIVKNTASGSVQTNPYLNRLETHTHFQNGQ